MSDKLQKNNIKLIGLMLASMISGVISGLVMPGILPLGFLAWFSLIPFIIALNKATSPLIAAILGLIFGFFINGISTFWFFDLWSLEWAGISDSLKIFISLFIWVIINTWIGLFFALFGFLSKLVLKSGANLLIKILAVGFLYALLTDRLLCLGDLAFPWAMIEYTQYRYLEVIQICKFIKGIGLSFLIICFNTYFAFLNELYKTTNNKISFCLKHLLLIGFFFTSLFTYGCYSLSKTPNTKDLKITIAQINFPEHTSDYATKVPSKYIKIAQNAKGSLIVFPETTNAKWMDSNNRRLLATLQNIAKNDQKTIIAGLWAAKQTGRGTIWANDAFLFDSTGMKKYTKVQRVPFGEFIPRWAIPKIIEEKFFDKTLPIDLEKGKEITVWETSIGKVAPNICYEILFPNIIHKQVKSGAEIIVNISNPDWIVNESVKEQLFAFATFRAIENSKMVVSSMNTGRSFIILPNGKTLYKAPTNVEVIGEIKTK